MGSRRRPGASLVRRWVPGAFAPSLDSRRFAVGSNEVTGRRAVCSHSYVVASWVSALRNPDSMARVLQPHAASRQVSAWRDPTSVVRHADPSFKGFVKCRSVSCPLTVCVATEDRIFDPTLTILQTPEPRHRGCGPSPPNTNVAPYDFLKPWSVAFATV